MGMTPEGRVKAEIKKILNEDAPQVWYYMPVQTGYGRAGIPDFIICAWGRFLAVEAKAGKGKVTAHQQRELARIVAAHGGALVINETNLGVLRETLRTIKQRAEV